MGGDARGVQSPAAERRRRLREAQPHADHYAYDAKRKMAPALGKSKSYELGDGDLRLEYERATTALPDAAVNYWRKVIRGVDQAENPMMRARQEERFRGHVGVQPAGLASARGRSR